MGTIIGPEELHELLTSQPPGLPVLDVRCPASRHCKHAALAPERAGFDAILYPGSFSEWSNNYDREVATGDQPG